MPDAQLQIDQIYDYIANDLCNIRAADNLISEMEKTFEKLEQNPKMFPELQIEHIKHLGYRKGLVENYIALHKVLDDTKEVWITHVFHSSQNYQEYI